MILVAVAIYSYCSGPLDIRGDGGSDAGGRGAEGSSAELEDLEVASAGSMSGYSREKFEHWSDAAEFGWEDVEESCDAREAALIRDGKRVEVVEGCEVESGRWLDPYTTNTYTDPLDIDIDHVVPLANAWRSGASSWSDAEREAYANAPEVLLSVEDNANQSKGDKGPEAWKPPNREIWCTYARQWIDIKISYELTATPQERRALEEMLGTC
jgi:hypothetical protein